MSFMPQEVPDESALIEDVKAGRRASFDVLVALYQHKGLNIAYNLVGNIEDAKDVLQEACIKMYINIKAFQARSKFSTWFYRIVINCALDFLRKRKRANRVWVELDSGDEDKPVSLEVPDVSLEPARLRLAKEFAQKLAEGLDTLSRMQRLCFILRHENSLAIQEISQTLNCRPATVKVHLFRAGENLRKRLSPYIREEGGQPCLNA